MIRGRGTDIGCLQKGGRSKRVLGYTKSRFSPLMIHASIHDVDVVLETKPGLFSPKNVDAGTAALLSCLTFSPVDKVLDLGCGYGVVGVIAANLIGPMIGCNTPYHADLAVPKHFTQKGIQLSRW